MFRKGLVAGIILLFIGIAVAPSVTSIDISNRKTSNSNDLVEITLQLCKTNGIEDHKMYITQEQNEQLDVLIESFKEDLENSESYEETVRIYNDMVVSLDELGLLPKGMSVKEAQRLVIGRSYKFSKIISLLQHFFKSDKTSDEELQEQNRREIYENYWCLLSWEATNTFFNDAEFWLLAIGLFIYFFTRCLFGRVYFGYVDYPVNGYPAVGWIHTQGLKGKWTYEGEFHGEMGDFTGMDPLTGYFRGARFFKGLRLKDYFFGHAMHVKIETEDPQ